MKSARQQGLSLIELMVAMVIGLVLILGVTQIFINNQSSYLFQQSQLGNQENGRFALALLNQELLKAGYRSNLGTDMPVDSSLSGCSFSSPGIAIVALSNTSFCIQYQATGKGDVSCLGTGLSSASRDAILAPYSGVPGDTTLRPKIVERISFDATTNSITCTTGTTTQQLVTGVRDARFEYGFGSIAEPKSVKGYSTSPMGPVTAVRYSVLMQSPGTARIRDNTSDISPALADWNTRYSTTYNDTQSIYQVVQGTTMIRNQMK